MVVAAASIRLKKIFTALLLWLCYCNSCVSIVVISSSVSISRYDHPGKVRSGDVDRVPLVQGKLADVFDHVRNVFVRQRRLPGRHERAFADRFASLGDNHGQVFVLQQIDVPLLRQGADVRHKVLGSSLTVNAVTTRTIPLIYWFAAASISGSCGYDRQYQTGRNS